MFKYYCTSEIFKIMKFRCPYPLYDKINISNRDTSLTIILSEKNNTFLYVAAQIWNSIHKQIVKSDNGLETSVSLVKVRVKRLILDCQAAGERDHWMDENFQLPTKILSQDIFSVTTTTALYPTSETMVDIVSGY